MIPVPKDADKELFDKMLTDSLNEATAKLLEEHRKEVIEHAKRIMKDKVAKLQKLPGA